MSESTNPTENQGGGVRSKSLIGVLIIGLVALAYDYKVARPAVNDAYDAISQRSAQVNATSTEVLTNMDVRTLLGKEPSRTFDDNGYAVEVFSWRAGLPIKTHDLFAVYKPNGGKNLFYRHAKYKWESSDEVSEFSTPRIIAPSEDMQDEEGGDVDGGEGRAEQDAGGSGPPGGPAGQRRGRGFDPEAMFAENDADGDGLLKGDEIPDRMRQNLAEIDTDGDDAVSKDELMARIAAMRAAGGFGGGRPGGGGPGGGGPGGDSRGGSGSRPPLESEEEASSDADSDGDAATPQEETAAEAKAEPETEAAAEGDAETDAEAETEEQPDADDEDADDPDADDEDADDEEK